MATTQYDIFQDAAIVLNDTSYRRWTPQILNRHLNRALRALVEIKPSAHTAIAPIALAAGVDQTLSSDTHVQIVRVIRNTASGLPCTPIDREILDASLPQWADTGVIAAATDAKHIILDRNEPRDFMVYPSNDGTGSLDMLVALYPTPLDDGPIVNTASSYTNAIPVGDIYREALTHLTISNALSADLAMPGTAERAMAHLNTARELLGLKRLHETTQGPRDAHKAEGNV